MKYTKLGNSDLNVSRICMGCMGFGDAANGQHSWTLDEEHSREIIKRGLELGVNFFDTAIGYQSETSEQVCRQGLQGSSILRGWWIKALQTSAWIMWIYTFTICGITRPRSMTSWKV